MSCATTPEKHAFLHTGGGHAVIYGPDGSSLAEKLPPNQEGLSMPISISA